VIGYYCCRATTTIRRLAWPSGLAALIRGTPDR
jgi:hypothetical protein